MTGTFVVVMPLQIPEASFSQIPSGSSVTSDGPLEDSSFFDLLQRHSSAMTAGHAFPDVSSVLRGQPSSDAPTPSIFPESLEMSVPETSSSALAQVANPVPIADFRALYTGKHAEGVVEFMSGKGASIVPLHNLGGQSMFKAMRQDVLQDVPALPAFPGSGTSGAVPGSQAILDPIRLSRVETAPFAASSVQEGEVPVSLMAEHGKMSTRPESSLPEEIYRQGQANQNPEGLKQPGPLTTPDHKFHTSQKFQGPEKIPVTDSGIGEVPENGEDGPPRRVVLHTDPAGLRKSHPNSSRPLSIVQSNGQPPEPPIPLPAQGQSVSGGFPLRPEAGGTVTGAVVMGGSAISVNETLPETGGSKPDPMRVQGIGDMHGANGSDPDEAGLQSGMGGFSHSQSGHQSFQSSSGHLPGANRIPAEVSQELPPQPLQRLQLDVQISETHRVQIDVGVHHRQVYAGLMMDHLALRNLALQNVPQLEEQFTNINMELSEFSAKTPEDDNAEADHLFQGRKPSSGFQEEEGGGSHARCGTFSRTPVQAEAGLHFVA